ncbi:MAG: hypothetical protein EAZ92_04955 [Candidatus Kapaibacterium sp.]|nr:MAG: hypothetical protein EAZ92_04955 [Candidatus Kapabacteria bacterium]
MTPTPLLLNAEFIALTLALVVVLLLAVRTAVQKTGSHPRIVVLTAVGIGAWLCLTAGVASTSFLWQFDAQPPRLFFLVAPTLLGMVLFARSRKVGELLKALSPAWIVGFQVFRVVMELILWQLFLANVIPVQMTFEGRNFDILVGLTAPIVARLLVQNKISRTALIAWNWVSLAILLNIVVVAVVSTPVPFRVFMNEPANTVILSFPFVWLPTVVVPIAVLGHIASLRHVR